MRLNELKKIHIGFSSVGDETRLKLSLPAFMHFGSASLVKPVEIDDNWKQHVGEYEIINRDPIQVFHSLRLI